MSLIDELNETKAKSGDDEEEETDDVVPVIIPPVPEELLSTVVGTASETSAEQNAPSNKIQPPPPTVQAPVWRLYPQLLSPPTPPGKRVIVPEPHPPQPVKPKAVDNHAVSYGLTAASVYARLQPTLRQRNGTGIRPKVIPRPYRRRPISSSTTASPLPADPPEEDIELDEIELDEIELDDIELEDIELEEEEEKDLEEREEVAGKEEEEKEEKEKEEEKKEVIEANIESAPSEPVVTVDEMERRYETDDELPESQNLDILPEDEDEVVDDGLEEEDELLEKIPPASVENETVKQTSPPIKSSGPPPAVDPMDIKALLRSAGPLSLSELLQQKGMSLDELLKGGTRVAPVVMGVSIPTTTSTTTSTTPSTTTATTSTTTTPQSPSTTTAERTSELPTVKPISLRELLAAKNLSLHDIVGSPSTTTTQSPTSGSGTLKPGVKLPVPFNPNRAKGLAGLVAPAASTETPSPPITQAEETSAPAVPLETKPTIELKPLTFGGKATVEEIVNATTTTSTTTTAKPTTTRTKVPYVPGTLVGEYGVMSHADDEDEDNSTQKSLFSNMVNSYGNQRPIATSRLTPAPPRKNRPILNFNYNELSEEDEEEGEGSTTLAPISTHFNEEELFEEHPYFNLPLSVRSAIIVSSAIGGFCLIVFLVILVVFKVRQKSRIRLRHPAALLGLAGHVANVGGGGLGSSGSGGSDSSGITTPVSHQASKSGYAKLPQRSSSLWGTLRRSVRQMEAVHYS